MSTPELVRCSWVNLKNPRYVQYHDQEWSVPCHDDHALYELLILECFQAGLSWECVLNKREAFRRAYEGFDAARVAAYGEEKAAALLADPGIIRNRLKVRASIRNSQVFLDIQAEFGSFDRYIWSFTDGRVIREDWTLRTASPLSDAVSADLKKRGMTFVGSTIIYSYLQAIGVLAAHSPECFCCRRETGERAE
ncbi:MAG: DNA-3-methyladenine glycosylase I [Oscillibacter sp.]|nr:DNA-3-methyladenine glycosylase I [Oscillibacter sp.]